MITNNAKKICDAVVNDWVSDFNELDDQFKINLSRRDFYHKTYPILGNKTFYNYLKDAVEKLTGQSSRYTYPTFKRRAEILISNGIIQNIKFGSIDSLTLDNALSKINVNISLKIEDFEDDNGNFNFESWFEYLLNNNSIEVTEEFDDISFFLMLSNLNNIIQFYGVLPYLIKFSDDRLYFYCIDFANNESTFFVSLTNPLASHFLKEI
ncbi:hypothetical protein [Streptococcus suis]|uniref:hypothetical protein n=1 Tax=Streptococcus suis TaxID=1307 RepID=UPI0037CFB3AB